MHTIWLLFVQVGLQRVVYVYKQIKIRWNNMWMQTSSTMTWKSLLFNSPFYYCVSPTLLRHQQIEIKCIISTQQNNTTNILLVFQYLKVWPHTIQPWETTIHKENLLLQLLHMLMHFKAKYEFFFLFFFSLNVQQHKKKTQHSST